MGISEENVVGLQFLMRETCSIAGWDKTTIVGGKVKVLGFLQKNGNCRDGLFLVIDWNEWKKIDVCVWECICLRRMEKGVIGYL